MSTCTIITGFIPELVPIPQDVHVTLSNELGSVDAGIFHVQGTGLIVEGPTELFGTLHVRDDDAFFDKNVTIYGGDLSLQSGNLFLNAGDYYINGIPLRSTISSDPNSIIKSGLRLDLDASKLDSYPQTGAQWYDQTHYENDLSFVSEGQRAEFNVHQFIVSETGDYGKIEDSDSLRPDSFTFGMYFNPSGEGLEQGNFVAGKLTEGNDTSYGFHYYNSGRLVSRIRFVGSASEVAVDGITWGDWHYITSKWDGTTHSIYSGGVYVAGDSSQSGAIIDYNDQPFVVGFNTGEVNSNNHFTGNIEAIHLYHGVLPEIEVRKNFLKTSTLTLHKDVNITGGLYVNGQNILDLASGISVFVEDGGNASVTGEIIKNIDVSSAGVDITGGIIEQLTYATNINNPGAVTVDGGTNDIITLNIDDSSQNLFVNNQGIGSTVLMRNYHGTEVNANITGYLFVIEPGSSNTMFNLNRAFIDRNSGILNIFNSGGTVDISGNNYITNLGGILNVSGNITGNINISGGTNTIDLDAAGIFQVVGGQQTIANSGIIHISGGTNYITGGTVNATGTYFDIFSGTTNIESVDPIFIEGGSANIGNSTCFISGSDSQFIVSFGTGTLDVTHSSILITDYVSGDEPAPTYVDLSGALIEAGGTYSPSFSNSSTYGDQYNTINVYSGVQWVNRDLLHTYINIDNAQSGSHIPISISGGVNALTGGLIVVTGGENSVIVNDSYLGKSDIYVYYGNNSIDSDGTMTVYITGSGIFNGTMSPTTANINISPYAIFQGNAVLSTANITSVTGIVTFNSGSECTTLNIGDDGGYGTYSTYITGDQTINLTLLNSYINELDTAYINGTDQEVYISDASVIYTTDSTNIVDLQYSDDTLISATGGSFSINAANSYYPEFSVHNPASAPVTADTVNIYNSSGIDIDEQVSTILITGSEGINIISGTNTINSGQNIQIGAFGDRSRVLLTTISESQVSLSGDRNYIYDSVNTIDTSLLQIYAGTNYPTVLGTMEIHTGTVSIVNPIQGEITIFSGVDTQVHNSGVVNFYPDTYAENVFGGIVNITNSEIGLFDGSGGSINMYDPTIGVAYQNLHFDPLGDTGIYIVKGDFSDPSSGFVVYTQRNLISGDVVSIHNGNNWLDFTNFTNTGSGNYVSIYGVSGQTTNNYISGSEVVTISGEGHNVTVYNSNASGNVPHIIQFYDSSVVTVDNTNSNGIGLVTGFGQAIIVGGITNVTGNNVVISGGINILQNDFSGEIIISGGHNLLGLSGDLTIYDGNNVITGGNTTIYQIVESGATAIPTTLTNIYHANQVDITGFTTTISFSGHSGSNATVNVQSDHSFFFDSTLSIDSGEFSVTGSTMTVGTATDVTVNGGDTTFHSTSSPIINSPLNNVIYGGFNTLPTGTIYYGYNIIQGDVSSVNLSGEGIATITHDGGDLDIFGGNVSIYGSGDNSISGSTVFIHGGENVITGDDISFFSGASATFTASGDVTVFDSENVYISGLSSGEIHVYDNDSVQINGVVVSATGLNISIIGSSGGHTIVNTPSSPNITGGLTFVYLSGQDFIFTNVDNSVISGSTVNMSNVEMATIYNGDTYFTGTVSGIVNGENVTMTFTSGMEVDVTAIQNTIINSGVVNVGDNPSIYHGVVPIYSGTEINIDRNSTITAYDSSFVADDIYSATLYSGIAFFTGINTSLVTQLNDSIGYISVQTGEIVDVVAYNTSTVFLNHSGSGAFVTANDNATINIMSGNINHITDGPVEIKLGINYVTSTGVTTQAGHNEITTDLCNILMGFNYFYEFTGIADISGLYNTFYDSDCGPISGSLNLFHGGNNQVIFDDRDTFNTVNHLTAFVDKSGDFHYISITGSGHTINATGTVEIKDYRQTIHFNDIYTVARSGTFIDISGNDNTINATGTGIYIRNFNLAYRTFVDIEKSGVFIDVSGNNNIVTGSGQTTINDYSNRYVSRYSIDESGVFIDVNGNDNIVIGSGQTTINDYTNRYVAVNLIDESGVFITVSGNENIVTGSGQTTINDYSNRTDVTTVVEKSGTFDYSTSEYDVTFVDQTGTWITISGNNYGAIRVFSGDAYVSDYGTTVNEVTIVENSGSFDYSTTTNVFVDHSGDIDYSTTINEVTLVDQTGTWVYISGDNNGLITGAGDIFVYNSPFIEKSGVFITVTGDNNIVTGSGETTIHDYSTVSNYDYTVTIEESGIFISVTGDNITVTGSGQTTIKDYSSTYNYDQRVVIDKTGTFITVSGSDNTITGSGETTIYDFTSTHITKEYNDVFITVSGDNNTNYITGSGETKVYDLSSTYNYEIAESGIFISVTGDGITVTGSGQTTIKDYSSSYSYTDIYNIDKSGDFYTISGNDNTLNFTGSGISVTDYSQNTTNVYQIDKSGSFVTITGTNQSFTITGSSGITVEDNRQQTTHIYQIDKSGTFITVTGSGQTVNITGSGIILNDYSFHPYYDQTITEINQDNYYSNVFEIEKSGNFDYYSITGSGNTFHFTGSGITVNDYSQVVSYIDATNIFDVRISGGINSFSGADDVYVTGERNFSTNYIYDSDVHIYNPLDSVNVTGGNQYFTGESISIYGGNAFFTNISGGFVDITNSDVELYNSGVVDVTGSQVVIYNGPAFIDVTERFEETNYIYTGYFITGSGNTIINISGSTSIVNITGTVTVHSGENNISYSDVEVYDSINTLLGNDSVYLTGTADLYGELGLYGNDNYFFPQSGSAVNVHSGIAHITGGLIHIGHNADSGIISGVSGQFQIGITGSDVFINPGSLINIFDSDNFIYTESASLVGGVNTVIIEDGEVSILDGLNTIDVSGDLQSVTSGVNTITTDLVDSVTHGVNTFNILHSGYVNIYEGEDTNVYATGNELTQVNLTYDAGATNRGTNNLTVVTESGGSADVNVNLSSVFAPDDSLINYLSVQGSNVSITGSHNIFSGSPITASANGYQSNATVNVTHNTFANVTTYDSAPAWTVYGPAVYDGVVDGDTVALNTINNLTVGITNSSLGVTINDSGTGYFTGPYASGSIDITGTVNNLSVQGGYVTLVNNTLTSNVDVDQSSVEINHHVGGNVGYINTSTVSIYSGTNSITGGVITVSESINDINVFMASGSDASLTLTNSVNFLSGGVNYISGYAYITGGNNYLTSGTSFITGGQISITDSTVNINTGDTRFTGFNSTVNIFDGDNYLYFPTGTYIYGDIGVIQSTGTIEQIYQNGNSYIGSIHHTGNIVDFDIVVSGGTIGTINLVSALDIGDLTITGSGITSNISSEANIDNFSVFNSEITNINFATGFIDIDTGIIGNVYITGQGSGRFDIDYHSGDLNVNAFLYSDVDQTASSSYGGGGAYITNSSDQGNGSVDININTFTGVASIDISKSLSISAYRSSSYGGGSVTANPSVGGDGTNVVISNFGELNIQANFSMGDITANASSYYGQSTTYGNNYGPLNTASVTHKDNIYQISVTGDGLVNITGSDNINIYGADNIFITGIANISGNSDVNVSGSDLFIGNSTVLLNEVTPYISITGGHNEVYAIAENHISGITNIYPSGHYIESGGFLNITGDVFNVYSGIVINQIFSGDITQIASGIIENVFITGGINDLKGDNLTLHAAYIGTLRNTDNSVTTGTFITTGNIVTGSGVLNVYNTVHDSSHTVVNLTGDHSHIGSVYSGTVNVSSSDIDNFSIVGGVNAISGGDAQQIYITGGDNTIDGGTATIIGNIANLILKDSVNTVTGGVVQVDGGINDITGHYVGITGGTNYINHNQNIDNIDAYGGTFHLQYNTGILITGTDFTVNLTDSDVSFTGLNNTITLDNSTLNATQTDGDIFVYESTVTAHSFTGLYITGGLNINYIDNRSGFATIDNSLLQTIDASSASVIKNYLTQVTTITGGTTYITGNVTGALIETANIYSGTTNIPVYASDGIGPVTINSGLTNLDYASGITINQGNNDIHDSNVALQGDSSNIYITGGINTFTGRNIDISGGINYIRLSGEDVLLYNSTMYVTGGSISYVSGHDIDIHHGTTHITDHPNEINVWYTQIDGVTNDAKVIVSGGLTNIYQFRNIERHSGAFVDVNAIGPESLKYQFNTHSSSASTYAGGSPSSRTYNNPGLTGSVHNVTGVSNTTNISGGVVNIYNAPRLLAEFSNNSFTSSAGYGGSSSNSFTPNTTLTVTDNEFTNTNTIHNSVVTITGTYDNIGQTHFDSGNTVNIHLHGDVLLDQPTGTIFGNIQNMTFTGLNKQLNVSGAVQIVNAHEVILQNFNDVQNVDSNVSVIDSTIGGGVNVYGGLTQVLGTNPVTFNLTTGDLAANTIIHHGQLNHGFAVGDVIRYELGPVLSPGMPPFSGYAKARADDISTSTALGVVKSVLGSSFEYISHGQIPYITGYTAGQPLYLSDVTSGQLTEVPPSSYGSSIVEVAQVVNGGHLIVSPHFSGTNIFPQNTGANIYPTKYIGSTTFGSSDTFYRDHMMAEMVIMTKKIDLTQTGNHVVHFGSEGYFYVDEAGLIVTNSTSSIVGPKFKLGYSGDLSGFADERVVEPITAGQRERYLALNDTRVTDNVIVTITSGATAGALEGKFYFKGFLTEDS